MVVALTPTLTLTLSQGERGLEAVLILGFFHGEMELEALTPTLFQRERGLGGRCKEARGVWRSAAFLERLSLAAGRTGSRRNGGRSRMTATIFGCLLTMEWRC